VSIATILSYLYPSADAATDYRIESPGVIVYWDADALGPQPTAQAIADAELPAAKAKKLADIRSEANALIVSKWPIWRQINAVADIYPQATRDEMEADIVSVVEASNAAESAVTAAESVADVGAVTATWPTL